MDISVALAFAKFDGAPKEVTEASEAYSKNYLALKKAQSQADIWNAQKKAAQDQNLVLLKNFQDAIGKWDPAKLNDPTPVEQADVSADVAVKK